MKILIGCAWPYANGSLHIGHLSSLIGGDVLARYHRLKGDTVCYVSGSDCHGTPIKIKARTEGVHPSAIADHYHREFEDSFRKLGFTYDSYGRTTSPYHKAFVREFSQPFTKKGFLTRKTSNRSFVAAATSSSPTALWLGNAPDAGRVPGRPVRPLRKPLDPFPAGREKMRDLRQRTRFQDFHPFVYTAGQV